MHTAPLLELTNATVVRDGHHLVADLTLTIHPGEHTAILGPNGSGKSSLIKLLTCEYYPVPHRTGPPPVRVLGRERWNVTELRSHLGIVSADLHHQFVDGNVSGRITGFDAVISGFFASQGLFGHQEVTDLMRQRATESLELVEALHLARKPMDAMSTGEARRILIARALVTAPSTLVLDEPTTGLDVVARQRFLSTIQRIARRAATLILVTHHTEEIIPEINRVILMQRGRIAVDGTRQQVLTSEQLSRAFEADLTVREVAGFYTVQLDSSHLLVQ